ncbi:hypothetical protein AcV5_003561 [Taiwanofungus camphoratus]|nr:hypothetical protein AcV5_003561 [Antrodia cinnamomea]
MGRISAITRCRVLATGASDHAEASGRASALEGGMGDRMRERTAYGRRRWRQNERNIGSPVECSAASIHLRTSSRRPLPSTMSSTALGAELKLLGKLDGARRDRDRNVPSCARTA